MLVHLEVDIYKPRLIAPDNLHCLHVDGLDGSILVTCVRIMIQRVDSNRKEVAVSFLIHTCATSWSKVIIYSYATRAALKASF